MIPGNAVARLPASVARPSRALCQARFPSYAARVTSDSPSRPLSPWRVVGLLVLGAALACFLLAAMPPVARPLLPADAEARGEAFEQALAAELTKVRPAGEEWAISIDPADINAWLATRLPKWIEHDPGLASLAAARSARIAAVDGRLVLEDAVRSSVGAQVCGGHVPPGYQRPHV